MTQKQTERGAARCRPPATKAPIEATYPSLVHLTPVELNSQGEAVQPPATEYDRYQTEWGLLDDTERKISQSLQSREQGRKGRKMNLTPLPPPRP